MAKLKHYIQIYQYEFLKTGSIHKLEHYLDTQLHLTAPLAPGSPLLLPYCPTIQQSEHGGGHEQHSEQSECFN